MNEENSNDAGLEPAERNRILIVDDEKLIQDVFQQVISSSLTDCRVDIAVNGAEGLEVFRGIHHGVILMDLRMPIMGGDVLFVELEKLCQEEKWEMPSVIFCSGYQPREQIQAILENSSLHCFLQKPVSPDVLIEQIRQRMGTPA